MNSGRQGTAPPNQLGRAEAELRRVCGTLFRQPTRGILETMNQTRLRNSCKLLIVVLHPLFHRRFIEYCIKEISFVTYHTGPEFIVIIATLFTSTSAEHPLPKCLAAVAVICQPQYSTTHTVQFKNWHYVRLQLCPKCKQNIIYQGKKQ